MIRIAELLQYFPNPNDEVHIDPFRFTIRIQEGDDTFIINLRIKQNDTKEEHFIKFRLGIGQDSPSASTTHDTAKPHFEADIYKRAENFKATIYFTFNDPTDDELMNYAKGTVVIISKIIRNFLEQHGLDTGTLSQIIYEQAVLQELAQYEPLLIEALYDCYRKSDIVIRTDGQPMVIKTKHNLQKYLDVPDLRPLYLPLIEKAKNDK